MQKIGENAIKIEKYAMHRVALPDIIKKKRKDET